MMRWSHTFDTTGMPAHTARITTWDPTVPTDAAHAAYHYVHAQRASAPAAQARADEEAARVEEMLGRRVPNQRRATLNPAPEDLGRSAHLGPLRTPAS